MFVCFTIPLSRNPERVCLARIAHMATPALALHLDADVAMRSESRTGPRATVAVIFSFCFFEMFVFVLRAADRHTLAAQRSAVQ